MGIGPALVCTPRQRIVHCLRMKVFHKGVPGDGAGASSNLSNQVEQLVSRRPNLAIRLGGDGSTLQTRTYVCGMSAGLCAC